MFEKDFGKAFYHLERAHVVGQQSPRHHTHVHWHMLMWGVRTRNLKEIFGQLIRIPTGFIGSILGIVPTGNTGGSNINLFQKLEISDELRSITEGQE